VSDFNSNLLTAPAQTEFFIATVAKQSVRVFTEPIAEVPHRGKNKRALWLAAGLLLLIQGIYQIATS
jgi:hypothetical protein